MLDRLVHRQESVQTLREHFASGRKLTDTDYQSAARVMSPEAAATIDRLSRAAQGHVFERLEIDDALNALKRRMDRDDK